MKVVHVIKRIETIDNDIKELRKLEKSITRDKSFTTPIFMTIEKQINILLGERIKLLELQILNPPVQLEADHEDSEKIDDAPIHKFGESKKNVKKTKTKAVEENKSSPTSKRKITLPDDDEIPMLTQDQIDQRFQAIENEDKLKFEKEEKEAEVSKPFNEADTPLDDTSIKLLDVALEKGTIDRKLIDKEKKIKFFRENFPSD
ncbi:MAG: hypothetical protein FWH53_11035 [Leptospirales bacterium]|nr:hypothetical protein [Leptospirales bacterium]